MSPSISKIMLPIRERLRTWWIERRIRRAAQRLQNSDARSRVRAVEELGRLHDPRTFDLLVAALADEDNLVRFLASLALAELNLPQAAGPLRSAHASEPDPYTRLWLAAGLAQLGDPGLLDALFVDIAALEAQGTYDWDSAPQLVDALTCLGEAALLPLSAVLTHPCKTVRWIAAWALGELGDARAIEPLRGALHDEDPAVREEVINALERLGAT